MDRKEFALHWVVGVAFIALYFSLMYGLGLLIGEENTILNNVGAALFLAGLGLWIGYMAQLYVTRLHDMNCSAFWVLLLPIPVVNILFIITIFLVPGSKHENRFGRVGE